MKLKWQWFVGGREMFWLSIILFIIFIIGFTFTFIVDPIELIYVNKQTIDTTPIKNISEQYLADLGIEIDKPIVYRFSKFKTNPIFKHWSDDEVLLGTFYKWNNTYYMDISIDLYNITSLNKVVIHETKHMIIQYMRDEGIIDLDDYTENIAREENKYYTDLFNSSVRLLKYMQEKE